MTGGPVDDGTAVILQPIRTLPYASAGCVGASTHRPVPTISEKHHVFPVYLQARVWPDVDPTRPHTARVVELVFLCGNCHATVHVVIEAILAGTPPPKVARKLAAIAARGIELFRAATP